MGIYFYLVTDCGLKGWGKKLVLPFGVGQPSTSAVVRVPLNSETNKQHSFHKSKMDHDEKENEI